MFTWTPFITQRKWFIKIASDLKYNEVAFEGRLEPIIFLDQFHNPIRAMICRKSEVTIFSIGWLFQEPITLVNTTDLRYDLGETAR